MDDYNPQEIPLTSLPFHEIKQVSSLPPQLIKNKIVMSRSKVTALLFISPVISFIILVVIQHLANSISEFQIPVPQSHTLEKLQPCFGQNCFTVSWTALGNKQNYKALMKQTARRCGLDPASVQELQANSQEQIQSFLKDQPNSTNYLIVFCQKQYTYNSSLVIPCTPRSRRSIFYNILYNHSLTYRPTVFNNPKTPYLKNTDLLVLKTALDSAILAQQGQNLTLSYSDFPLHSSRFAKGYNALNNHGAFYLFLPLLLNMALLILDLLNQAEKGQRMFLEQSGLSSFQYAQSWCVTQLLVTALLSLIITVGSSFTPFKLFDNVSSVFLFLFYFISGLAFSSQGWLVVSLSRSKREGTSGLLFLVIISVSLQLLFSGGYLGYLINSDLLLAKVMRVGMSWLASYHYSVIFSILVYRYDSHFNLIKLQWQQGSPMTLSSLFQPLINSISTPVKLDIQINSLAVEMGWLVLIVFANCSLAWFLDQLFKKGNNPFSSKKDSDCSHGSKPIEVHSLSKSFYNFCGKQKKALRNVDLQVDHGEVVGLLGKNGAGKSTLISIVSAVLRPSSGNCYIFGNNTQSDSKAVSKLIASCPQFDIFWQQLSVMEHMELIAKVKGLSDAKQQCEQMLLGLDLFDKMQQKVSSLSGGMKRRLSIALASLGRPRVLIFDEPSTGLDPFVKSRVWQLIKSMRSQKSMLLTTHIMQQAQNICQKICFIKEGAVLEESAISQLERKKKKYVQICLTAYEEQSLSVLISRLGEKGVQMRVTEGNRVQGEVQEEQLSCCWSLIEEECGQLIRQWSMQNTSSLQQLFLSIHKQT